MSTYKITPTNIFTGATAPSLLINSTDSKLAIQEAKTLSRLSSFDNWTFECEIIKNN